MKVLFVSIATEDPVVVRIINLIIYIIVMLEQSSTVKEFW